MRQRTRLVFNASVNVGSRVVAIATRFVIVPFSIGVLGRTHYGVWVVIGQMLGYTRILEMGIRASVSRQVAMRLERGEHESLGRHINTAVAHYSIAGVLVAAATVVVSLYFPGWFDVEPRFHMAARTMVLCAGFTFALSLPQFAYEGILVGLQRFDIIAGTNIASDLLRMALILLLLQHFDVGGGMIVLAVATGGCALITAVSRTFAAKRIYSQTPFAPWRADRTLWGSMATYGFNTVVYLMAAMVAAQLAQILIGVLLSTAAATDFRVAMELILAVHAFVTACALGIRPAASRYDGANDVATLRRLMNRTTRYVGCVTLLGVMVLTVFIEPVLRLWQGGNYPGEDGAAMLSKIASAGRILSIGYAMFWLSLPAYNVVNGMGRHRFPAVIAGAAGVLAMGLVAIFAASPGTDIARVAWGVTLPMVPVWGLAIVWYCCREINEPVGTFLREGLLPPCLACLPAIALGVVVNHLAPATGWALLIVELAGCGLMAAAASWWIVLLADDRQHFVSLASNWLRRRNGRGDGER